MRKFYKSGFTLIELLIVIAVISGLVGIFVTSYPGVQKRARDTHRKNDLKQYQTALESYANSHSGIYPIFASAIDPSDVIVGVSNDVCNDHLGLSTNECPEDPKDGKSECTSGLCRYYYVSNASGTEHALWARLEMPKDTSKPLFIVCSNGRSFEGDTAPTAASVCP